MGIGDKIQNEAEHLGGKAKEATGNATNNDQLRAEVLCFVLNLVSDTHGANTFRFRLKFNVPSP